jgi:2-octaprenyl-6-methoxyphenol hydroxylase
MTQSTKIDYDIVIVGGGITGLVLARLCQNLKLKIALIELRAIDAACQDPRTLALAPSSVNLLSTLGCFDVFKQDATAIQSVHVSHKGHLGAVRIAAADMGLPSLGVMTPLGKLARTMFDSIDPKRVDLIGDTAVTAAVNHEGHVALTLGSPPSSSGASATRESSAHQSLSVSEKHSITATLVIAADGANSPVREMLGVSSTTRDYGQSALVTEVDLAGDHDYAAYERFTKTGPIALLPNGKKHATVVWCMARDDVKDLLALDVPAFETTLQKAFGYRAGKLKARTQRAAFPLIKVTADEPFKGRVLFFGNAAHSIHPVAGQGLNLTLRDAANLFELLKTGSQNTPALMAAYVELRHKDHKNIVKITDQFARIFTSEHKLPRIGASFGLRRIERNPLLKKHLNDYLMGMTPPLAPLLRGGVLE